MLLLGIIAVFASVAVGDDDLPRDRKFVGEITLLPMSRDTCTKNDKRRIFRKIDKFVTKKVTNYFEDNDLPGEVKNIETILTFGDPSDVLDDSEDEDSEEEYDSEDEYNSDEDSEEYPEEELLDPFHRRLAYQWGPYYTDGICFFCVLDDVDSNIARRHLGNNNNNNNFRGKRLKKKQFNRWMNEKLNERIQDFVDEKTSCNRKNHPFKFEIVFKFLRYDNL